MTATLTENSSLSHYRIISKLGAGGMGEVWLAEDTRLKRKVALKLLPAELTSDPDRVRRFEQEAQAASALSHPNIITVYDIGESEAGRYIVMELVSGQTLKALASGPPSIDTILKLGTQVCQALQAAHDAGITHRDIKPDNVMLRDDGYVKVLDFGLARLQPTTSSDSEAATLAQQTLPGTVMGTVAYMSPEQASGKTVGPPSDVFALGVVLYELATGEHPFKSETLLGYLHAITSRIPQPLSLHRADLPVALNDLIMLMLQKGADQRPTAGKVAQALEEIARTGSSSQPRLTPRSDTKSAKAGIGRWVIAGLLIVAAVFGSYFGIKHWFPVNGEIDSLAVLPFLNQSGNADSEYLSDGLAESLIYRLSQLKNLKVSPTSSVFRYKKQERDPLAIAKELGVRAVMTGRVQQRGDILIISVELVDAIGNKILWGDRYERKLSDLLTFQREMASEITQRLQLKLSGDSEQKLAKKYTNSNEAYQLYLQGRFHWSKRTKEEVLKSIDSYKRALALDPKYALAYAAIADCYNSMAKDPDVAPKEAVPFAKEAAYKALELDPMLAEAHAALGDSLAIYDWNWTESEKEFNRALEIDPNVSYIHLAHATSLLAPMGKTQEAIREIERALELEPLSLITNSVLVTGYLYGGQNEKALQQGHRAMDLDPTFLIAHHWLGLAQISNGQFEEARKTGEDGLRIAPTSPEMLLVIGRSYAIEGRRQEAEQVIERMREIAKVRYVRRYWLAGIYAGLGEKDKAFEELERSFEARDSFLPRAGCDPMMDPLRNDDRFKNLLRRMNISS